MINKEDWLLVLAGVFGVIWLLCELVIRYAETGGG